MEITTMEYTDKRLPHGVTIWANDFGEFVATEMNTQDNRREVAQIGNKNVKAGRTANEAVQHYLTRNVAAR